MKRLGRRSLALPCDATDSQQAERLRDAVIEEFGTVQILVDGAGHTRRAPTLDYPESEWNSILETNLNGTCEPARSSQARCYALVGIHKLNPTRFNELVRPLAE